MNAALIGTVTSLPGSDGGVIETSKGHGLLNRIHDILDSTMSKWVSHYFLILHPGSIMKSGFQFSPFFTALVLMFLIVSLAFMVTSVDLWHRLTNSPLLDCPRVPV